MDFTHANICHSPLLWYSSAIRPRLTSCHEHRTVGAKELAATKAAEGSDREVQAGEIGKLGF